MNLADEPLSPIQFGVLRHAEQIYFPETYALLATTNLKWRPVRFVNFVWMMVGKGGGKDRVAALAQLRIVYLLLCLRRPQQYMRIGSTSKIHLLNTASSEGQAEQIFFEELKGLLEHSPFFRGRFNGISREINYDKRIVALSGNSKEESQEGMNLLFGCLDEIDAFRTKEERERTARTSRGAMLNAEGIFDMMRTSGGSRYPFNFKVMGLSWPRYVGSFIWTKHRDGLRDLEEKGSASRTYVVPRLNGAATWESNPTKRFEDYAADFEENPELARAKYMCMPPESEEPYFRNRVSLEAAFQETEAPEPLEVEYFWGYPADLELEEGPLGYRPETSPHKPPEAWQVHLRWDPSFLCHDSIPRAIHVDTGIVSDRCGFAMSHVRGYTTHREIRKDDDGNENEVIVRRPLVTTDLITYFEAPKATPDHPRGEVELRWVRRLIWEIIGRGFPVALVTFDGFQSTDSIQLLKARGIEAELFSLDRKMEGYDTAKSVAYHGGHLCRKHPLLMQELRALTVVMGKKVDHPPGGSKDLADAWAGSVNGAIKVSEFGLVGVQDFEYEGKPGWGDELRGIDPSPVSAVLAGIPDGADEFAGPPR